MAVQNVYIDEAGFTGGNLLDGDQPELVFAAVAMGRTEASAVWSEMISRSGTNASELKGANLTRHPKGRAAITWLLENTGQSSKLAAVNKRYALAGKFFEYIFEPVLANKSGLFYTLDFHKFVTMALYTSFVAGHAHALHIFENFQDLMKDSDPRNLTNLYSPTGYALAGDDLLTHILTFALCNQGRVTTELQGIRQVQTYPRWALELSATTVHCLLAGWAEDHEPLRVYCDDSKPIAAAMDFFEHFVSRQDKAFMPFGVHQGRSFIYNLSENLHLVASEQSHGVQIADVWASSIAYAFRNREGEICQTWLEIAADSLDTVIFPDYALIDADQVGPMVNWVLLLELSRRSVAGESVLAGIEEFIGAAVHTYQIDTQ